MSIESTTGFHRQFPEDSADWTTHNKRSRHNGVMSEARRQALYPFSCLADLLPEAIRPEETVTLEIKAGDLMLARKAYLEGM